MSCFPDHVGLAPPSSSTDEGEEEEEEEDEDEDTHEGAPPTLSGNTSSSTMLSAAAMALLNLFRHPPSAEVSSSSVEDIDSNSRSSTAMGSDYVSAITDLPPCLEETTTTTAVGNGDHDASNTTTTTPSNHAAAENHYTPAENSSAVAPLLHSTSSSSSSSSTRSSSRNQEHGSSLGGAIFNFTNCIIGAGAIGLGGAFAESGGLISIVTLSFFACLVKLSADLIMELSIYLQTTTNTSTSSSTNNGGNHNCSLPTYEDLGYASFGTFGKLLVLGSKFIYAFGCLVAYTKVIQDNFSDALKHIIYGSHSNNNNDNNHDNDWLYWLLDHQVMTTYVISTTVVLPLCLLRDMTPLASASILSIVCMCSIVSIVFYLWAFGDPSNYYYYDYYNGGNETDFWTTIHKSIMTNLDEHNVDNSSHTSNEADILYHHWLEIRWGGFLNNIGTFVFSFVCQHTAHMTYTSLKPKLRTMKQWRKISAAALTLSAAMSLAVGLLVYMTFWEHAVSDMFELYPPTILMDVAKLLLCITMLFTFPLPFFTCRELMIVFFFPFADENHARGYDDNGDDNDDHNNNNHNNPNPRRLESEFLLQSNLHDIEDQQQAVVVEEQQPDDNDGLRELREPLLPPPQTRSVRSQSNGEETANSFYTAASEGLDSSRCLDHQDNEGGVGGGEQICPMTNLVHNMPEYATPGQDRIPPPTQALGRTQSTDDSAISLADVSVISARAIEIMNSALLPGQERQLKLPYHIGTTCKLWFVVTGLAVTSPSLGDVLDLVGCASGTLIAFILPGLFTLKLQGFRPLAAFLLLIGGIVGIVGTTCSLRKFVKDTISG